MVATFPQAESDPVFLAEGSSDTELDAALAALLGSAPVAQLVAGFDVARHHTGTKPIIVTADGGVISDPGENGHIYFETSADNVDWTTFQKLGYVACRNKIENIGQIGNGEMVWGVVRPGHWYRYRTYTAANYATPEFVFDTGFEWVYQVKS